MHPFLRLARIVSSELSLPCPRPCFEAQVSLQMHTFNHLPDGPKFPEVSRSFQKFPQPSRSFQKSPRISLIPVAKQLAALHGHYWCQVVGPERGVQKSMRNNAKHCFATQNSRLLQDFGMISFILAFHTSWAQSPSVNQTTIQSIVPSHNNDSCTDPPCLAQFSKAICWVASVLIYYSLLATYAA